MSDGTTLNPGAGGDTIAADDLGAAGKVQWVKLRDGTDGGTDVIPGTFANGLLADVSRIQGTVTVTGPVTDAQLRATPVPVEQATSVDVSGSTSLGLDAATLAALETIGLDAATLAALETINAVISDGGGSITVDDGGASLTVDGTVALDAATLAALETINAVVSGTVALDAPSLAALETIELGATTLAALESITIVDGGGSLTVDAPVGTPVFVRLSDGSAAITTLPVSLASVPSHAVTNAGTFATQENGGALTALQLLDDTIFADDVAFTPGTSKVSALGMLADSTATDSVDEGDIGIPRMTLDRKQFVTLAPSAENGGWTMHRTISAATTNATSVKASAGKLGEWYLWNANAAVRYLKLYNKASAPTVGTDTPVRTIPIPPGSAANMEVANGLSFSTGIAFAITTGVADSDTGAVAANEIVVNLGYV